MISNVTKPLGWRPREVVSHYPNHREYDSSKQTLKRFSLEVGQTPNKFSGETATVTDTDGGGQEVRR